MWVETQVDVLCRWARRAAAVLAMFALVGGALAGPAAAHTELAGPGLLEGLLSGGGGSNPSEPTAARPGARPDPGALVDRVSPPAVLVRPELVSATLKIEGQDLPLVIPAGALPWGFHVDEKLASRFGERAVYDAVRQWDGIPGSRWATRYLGVVSGGKAEADGRSVLFLQSDCPEGVGGYAYWQTRGGSVEQRYGQGAVYITEVDIGVCSGISTAAGMRRVVAHEIGHAFGLQHLCDPGQDCWRPGMGQGPHHCRVLYAGDRHCNERTVDAREHDAAVHLYPTLPRLAGPGRVETAARASYATFAAASASTVIVARGDGTAHGPLAAAAVAGALDAPFLLGVPDGEHCLTGAAAEELGRVASARAAVTLVGAWPERCEAILRGWGLQVDRVNGRTPVELGTALATKLRGSGRMGKVAVLVTDRADARGHVPDGVAGGAAAGSAGGPVLYTGPDALDPAVQRWISDAKVVDTVYVLGGQAALSDRVVHDLRGLGVTVNRVGGSGRIETALALASRRELFAAGAPVVIASAQGWPDAVTGSAVGAGSGSPVLLTPASSAHPAVESWLRVQRPVGGYVVGGMAVVTPELQWRYARSVR